MRRKNVAEVPEVSEKVVPETNDGIEEKVKKRKKARKLTVEKLLEMIKDKQIKEVIDLQKCGKELCIQLFKKNDFKIEFQPSQVKNISGLVYLPKDTLFSILFESLKNI